MHGDLSMLVRRAVGVVLVVIVVAIVAYFVVLALITPTHGGVFVPAPS